MIESREGMERRREREGRKGQGETEELRESGRVAEGETDGERRGGGRRARGKV